MSIRLKGAMYALLHLTLLSAVPPVMMAAFPCIGAGACVSVLYTFHAEKGKVTVWKNDLPCLPPRELQDRCNHAPCIPAVPEKGFTPR